MQIERNPDALNSAVGLGVYWWTAAGDADGVDRIAGPDHIDAAHIALALDAAQYLDTELRGTRGTCETQVVLLDADDEPLAVVYDADDPNPCGSRLTRLPRYAAADLTFERGALDLPEILHFEGAVWDGHNHVPIEARRARRFVLSLESRQIDGHVTWIFDDDGDAEYLADVVVAAGYVQMDYYATSGYGNDPSTWDYEDVCKADRALRENGMSSEVSYITDDASNEPAEAWIWIVAAQDETAALQALREVQNG